MEQERGVDDTTAWDIGGRIVREASDSISLSGEAVQRMWSADSLTENSLRAVGSFEVKVADKAYLFATFGRDFTEVELERNLVSIVGLTWRRRGKNNGRRGSSVTGCWAGLRAGA